MVPRRVRVFVWAFLVAFVVCGFARIEAWPLTGWRLFSVARMPVQASWQAVLVDSNGREYSLPFSRSFKGTAHLLARFPSLTDRARLAACDAWSGGSMRLGVPSVFAVRIYRVVRDVGDRRGKRGAPPSSRALQFTCKGGRVEVAP